jgi:hypothetical protein
MKTQFLTPLEKASFHKAWRLLGKRAFHALLDPKVVHDYEVEAVVRRFLRSGRTLKETRDAAFLVRATVNRVRHLRQNLRRKRSPHLFCTAEPWIQISYRLPIGSVQGRLIRFKAGQESKRKAAILERFVDMLGASRVDNESAVRLPLGSPWEGATAKAWITRGDKYSSRCTFRKTYANVEVTFPHDFESTVDAEGIAELDGLLTLAAQRLEEKGDEIVWKARWARKARGFSFIVEDGYIVCRGEEFAHGKSVQAARSILSRRATEARLQALERKLLASADSRGMNAFGTILVTIADSLAAGNCETGTLAFRDRYFPGRDSATVEEILHAAETFSGRKLAIAACFRAIRSSRVTRGVSS